MPRNNSATRAEATAAAVARRPRLRDVAGGYDINRWPIQVPRADGESLNGWLRRVASRYGVSPHQVLAELEIDVRSQVRLDFPALIAQHGDALTLTGLDPAAQHERVSAIGAAWERIDHEYWKVLRYRKRPHWTRAARYCPRCLAETSLWSETWHHPYQVACIRHGVMLAQRCPRCTARPYEKPSWLSHIGPVDTCADFAAESGGYRRLRCGAVLSQTEPEVADEQTLAAQRWLLEIVTAAAGGSTVTAIGLVVAPTIAYAAAGEIITENLDAERAHSIPAETDALRKAHMILSQVDVRAAGLLAGRVRGFEPHTGLAPLGHIGAAYQRPRNPLLVAISLQQHQGHLSYGSELKFRVGTPAPRYPTAWRVQCPPLTEGAAHPEIPLAWIPAGLWDGVITLGVDSDARLGIGADVGRAFAALALARFGSVRPWRYLAVNLALPAGLASHGAKHWKALDTAGLWPMYVAAIGDFFQRLHRSPPPIDYEQRRISAQPALVLQEATRALAASPALGRAVEQHQYASALWPTYTGGILGLAPAEIRATAPPRNNAIPREALTESALRLGKPDNEPLEWQPP